MNKELYKKLIGGLMFYLTEEYSYNNIKNYVNTTNNKEYTLLTTENEYTHGSKTKLKTFNMWK